MPDSGQVVTVRPEGDALSPFELKDRLMDLATHAARERGRPLLDAGRGNPDWLELSGREAFFALGRVGCEIVAEHSRRHGGLSALRALADDDAILAAFLAPRARDARCESHLLPDALDWLEAAHGLSRATVIGELVRAALGGQYPEPVGVLPCVEAICRLHLACVYGWSDAIAPTMSLFATEGASAAICYVMDALVANGLLRARDRVAVAIPIFSPYLDILGRTDPGLEIVPLVMHPEDAWRPRPAELARLRDPAVRLLVVVNPGNPTSAAWPDDAVEEVARIVRTERSDLLVLSDDVYGPLVPGYAAFAARLPQNTIGVYSFSKFFGATGWRLGLVSLASDHVADRLLREQPAGARAQAAGRYRGLSGEPEALSFMERLVAESRRTAFHHTAGLSTPQQAQMAAFALAALLDEKHGTYRTRVRSTRASRRRALWAGLELDAPVNAGGTDYYETLDLAALVAQWHGIAAAERFAHTCPTLDIVLSLAREQAVVVLPAAGFGASRTSVRVSLANLPEAELAALGRAVRAVCARAVALSELSA